jgi:hypothetical protein
MLSRLTILLAVICPTIATAQVAPKARAYLEGHDLHRACKISSAAGAALCGGFILGVADSMAAVGVVTRMTSICTPSSATPDQLRTTVVRFLENNPERRGFAAHSLVTFALEQAYPCGKR